jgi:chitinase
LLPEFLKTALSGVLPGGQFMKAATLGPLNFMAGWDKLYDVSLPLAGELITDVDGWVRPLTPNQRVFEIFGSYAYRTGMSYLDGKMNLLKKQIFMGHQIIGDKLWRDNIKLVNAGDIKGAKVIMGKLQQVYMTFLHENKTETLSNYL